MSELPSLNFYRTADVYSPIPATCYDERSPLVMEAIQSKGFFTHEIRDGIFYITEGWYFMLAAVHDEGVIVVDAPPSIGPTFAGENITHAISEITDKPITHVIYSHHHSDHIGAGSVYPQGVSIIAHEECAAYLESANDPQRPVPTETFKDSYSLDVGGQTLRLDYHGLIHSAGNIFIYAPRQRILMNVDVIFPGWVPFSSLAMAADLRGFLRGHDVALSYDFDTFVPGHLTRLGTREDIEIQKAYFDDLVQSAMQHLDDTIPSRNAFNSEVQFMGIAEQVGGFENAWLVFDAYLNTVTDKVVEDVLPRWESKLAAADVFTRSHAWEVVERLRIDA